MVETPYSYTETHYTIYEVSPSPRSKFRRSGRVPQSTSNFIQDGRCGIGKIHEWNPFETAKQAMPFVHKQCKIMTKAKAQKLKGEATPAKRYLRKKTISRCDAGTIHMQLANFTKRPLLQAPRATLMQN